MALKKMTPDDWLKRIDHAILYKEQFGSCKRWADFRDYYRGIFAKFTPSALDKVLPYNITYMFARTIIPNVYFRNPYVMISPRPRWGVAGEAGTQVGMDRQIQAKVKEAVANWLVQELNLKATMKTAALDCYLVGRGIIKVGFDSEYGMLPGMEEMEADETTQTAGDVQLEYKVNVKPGMPWALRQDPDMILVPYGVRVQDECEWIDHIILRDLEAAKMDRKYDIESTMEGSHIDKVLQLSGKKKLVSELGEAKWLEIHEIRDAARKQVLAMVTSSRDEEGLSIEAKYIMKPGDDVLQIEGLPYVSFTFNEDPEYYWAASDAQMLEPQQLEINETAMQAMYHRRISILKGIYQQGAFDQAEIEKLRSEEVLPFVESKIAPEQAVKLLQPHIPPDLPMWIEGIRSSAREIMGIGRPQAGVSERSSRRTAREAMLVQQGHDVRMGEKRDAIADALALVVRKVMQIAVKFWTTSQVTQVVGYDGARYWVRYEPKELAAEVDVKVDVESMSPQTKASRRQDLVQIIQALSKHPTANIDYLMRMLLREFDWVDAMKVLPEAQETMGQPMGMQQFGQQQQELLANPAQLQKRAGANAQKLALGAGGGGG